MRRILNILPMIMLATGLQGHSRQPVASTSDSAHRIQVFRAGKGEPRVREAAASRTAVPRTPAQARDMGITRAYQVPKPGEGSPKD